jgi:conserved oligomeric Golgi complex subunit 6
MVRPALGPLSLAAVASSDVDSAGTANIATPTTLRASTPLAAKVTSVLAASYADSDFRDALLVLDAGAVADNGETRRQLRLRLQKEVLESNGAIVDEFGQVADVGIMY